MNCVIRCDMIKIKSWLCILMCLNVASLAPGEAGLTPTPEDALKLLMIHSKTVAPVIANPTSGSRNLQNEIDIAQKIFGEAVKEYGLSPQTIGIIIDACMTKMVVAMKNKNGVKPINALSTMQKTIEQALKDIPEYIEELNVKWNSAYCFSLEKMQDYVPLTIEVILKLYIESNAKTIEKLGEKANADNKQLIQDLMGQNMVLHMRIAQSPESQELTKANERIAELGVKLEGMQSLNASLVKKLKASADELTKAIARIEELKENLKEAEDRAQGISEAFEEYKTASVKTANELREQCKMLSKRSELRQTKIAKLSELNGILETGNQELEATELSKIACAALVDVDRLKKDLIKANEAKTAAEKAAEEQRTENEKYLKSKEHEIEKLKQLIAGHNDEKLDQDRRIEKLTKARDELFAKFTEANSKEKTSKLESLKSLNGTNSMQGQYNRLSRAYDVLLEENKKLQRIIDSCRMTPVDKKLDERRAVEIIKLYNELKELKQLLNETLVAASQQPQSTSSSSSSGAMPSTGSGPTLEEVQLAANNLQFSGYFPLNIQ